MDDGECLGDSEILLLVWDGAVLYSSLGSAVSYGRGEIRAMDVYKRLHPGCFEE